MNDNRSPEEHRKEVARLVQVATTRKAASKVKTNAGEVIARDGDGAQVIMHPAMKGAINEHLATAWLMRNGYDVFRNVSPVGRADLIANRWDGRGWIPIDVKSGGYNPYGVGGISEKGRRQATKYSASEVRYLIVGDGGDCSWYNKLPPKDRREDMWKCPKTGREFPHPEFDLDADEMHHFGRWILIAHKDALSGDEVKLAELARESMWTGGSRYPLRKTQKEDIKKLHKYIYGKLTGKNPDEYLIAESEALHEAA